MCPIATVSFMTFPASFSHMPMGQVFLSLFHSLRSGGSVKWNNLWKAADHLDASQLTYIRPYPTFYHPYLLVWPGHFCTRTFLLALWVQAFFLPWPLLSLLRLHKSFCSSL